ncbi:hypothetical protein [Nostoc sp.]
MLFASALRSLLSFQAMSTTVYTYAQNYDYLSAGLFHFKMSLFMLTG